MASNSAKRVARRRSHGVAADAPEPNMADCIRWSVAAHRGSRGWHASPRNDNAPRDIEAPPQCSPQGMYNVVPRAMWFQDSVRFGCHARGLEWPRRVVEEPANVTEEEKTLTMPKHKQILIAPIFSANLCVLLAHLGMINPRTNRGRWAMPRRIGIMCGVAILWSPSWTVPLRGCFTWRPFLKPYISWKGEKNRKLGPNCKNWKPRGLFVKWCALTLSPWHPKAISRYPRCAPLLPPVSTTASAPPPPSPVPVSASASASRHRPFPRPLFDPMIQILIIVKF